MYLLRKNIRIRDQKCMLYLQALIPIIYKNARITIPIYKSSVKGIGQFSEIEQLCLFNFKCLFKVGFFLTAFQGYQSNQEVERSGVQGHPQLCSEFQASLSQMRPCLKTKQEGGEKERQRRRERIITPSKGLPARLFGLCQAMALLFLIFYSPRQ